MLGAFIGFFTVAASSWFRVAKHDPDSEIGMQPIEAPHLPETPDSELADAVTARQAAFISAAVRDELPAFNYVHTEPQFYPQPFAYADELGMPPAMLDALTRVNDAERS
jgi:hypothetical protein